MAQGTNGTELPESNIRGGADGFLRKPKLEGFTVIEHQGSPDKGQWVEVDGEDKTTPPEREDLDAGGTLLSRDDPKITKDDDVAEKKGDFYTAEQESEEIDLADTDYDFDSLMQRWLELELPVEELPDAQDFIGQDKDVEIQRMKERIRRAEEAMFEKDRIGDGYSEDGISNDGKDETTMMVDPETLPGTINVTLSPGFITQESAIGYLQGKLTPEDLEEIWNTTNEVVIRSDENANLKIGIKTANGKDLNLSLDDFLRMTRTEIDGKSYGLEAPEIDSTDQYEPEKRYLDIRPVENLLNRLKVKGQSLGRQTPPTFRYVRDAS